MHKYPTWIIMKIMRDMLLKIQNNMNMVKFSIYCSVLIQGLSYN